MGYYAWSREGIVKVKSYHLIIVMFLLLAILSKFNHDYRMNFLYDVDKSLQDTWYQEDTKRVMDITIIGIDQKSIEELGRFDTWPRTYMADAINKLSQGKPAVIGIDVLFTGASDAEADQYLVQAAEAAGNVVVGVKGLLGRKTTRDGLDVEGLEEPFDALNKVVRTGHINTRADDDGVVRSSIEYFNYNGKIIDSFDKVIYDEFIKNTGAVPVENKPSPDFLHRKNISFEKNIGDFGYISFVDLLNGEIPVELQKDKIVLIGPYDYGMMDSYITPTDKHISMHGIEIHANILQNYILGSFKQPLPWSFTFLASAILCMLGYMISSRLKPGKAGLVILGVLILYMLGSRFLYFKGYMISIFYPVALVILTYLIILVYRYLEEYFERRRITGIFSRYVAPQVVDQILKEGEDGLKLGGTRREISVLFVDIRGFTPLSEKMEPEEVVGILNLYLNLTASSIFANGGTVDKFIGDATMALFNAPLDLEDHEFKAVKAAWAMKQGAAALKQELEAKYGRSVSFGIGVNTGYAVVGNIGADFRMDYTAIGDTVNTAARLESNAKPDQILLSSTIYEKVKDRVQATSLGEIKVKGKEEGLLVYQLDDV